MKNTVVGGLLMVISETLLMVKVQRCHSTQRHSGYYILVVRLINARQRLIRLMLVLSVLSILLSFKECVYFFTRLMRERLRETREILAVSLYFSFSNFYTIFKVFKKFVMLFQMCDDKVFSTEWGFT